MKRITSLAVALVIALASTTPAHAARPTKISGEITVLAASSLTEAFTEIGERFEARHPDADVTFSFNASSILVTQIQQGGPADVIATADEASMDRLVDGEQVDVDSPSVFVRNTLQIAVASGNPKHLKTLEDTLADDVTLVLCAPEAPCGRYARQAYTDAGLRLPTVPTGANAKDTLAKVALGEADAAVVYVTDVRAAQQGGLGDVDGVKIPDADNVIATYAIAPLVDAENSAGAKAFVLFVESRVGQKVLRRFGFLTE